MLRSHNTIPSKVWQPQDGRGEAGGGAGVEVGDREPRGSSKNKERIITATYHPGSTTLFLTLKSPISLRRGLLRSPTNFSDLNS